MMTFWLILTHPGQYVLLAICLPPCLLVRQWQRQTPMDGEEAGGGDGDSTGVGQ